MRQPKNKRTGEWKCPRKIKQQWRANLKLVLTSISALASCEAVGAVPGLHPQNVHHPIFTIRDARHPVNNYDRNSSRRLQRCLYFSNNESDTISIVNYQFLNSLFLWKSSFHKWQFPSSNESNYEKFDVGWILKLKGKAQFFLFFWIFCSVTFHPFRKLWQTHQKTNRRRTGS